MTDQPLTGTTDIDFLRSTTTTITDRQADGDKTTKVTHLARFGVRPGALIDIAGHRKGTTFQPQWLEVEWTDGRLATVIISGPRRRKDGTPGQITGRKSWWTGYASVLSDEGAASRVQIVRDALPSLVADAIAAYERAVAGQSHGSTSL